MARTLVVIPTYNRSNVLKLAVESVLAQSDTDWQLLVIGDACTDDSQDVVEQFSDARIAFCNRPCNFGNMAIPINEAIALGLQKWPEVKRIALLSHDDLWLPEHLAQLNEMLDRGVDLAICPYFECERDKQVLLRHVNARHHIWLKPMTMSAWLFSKALWQRVGNWRAPAEIYDVPSADWWFRAWRLKARIEMSVLPSLLVVNSTIQERSYARRSDAEQVFWAARLGAADIHEQLMRATQLRTVPSAPTPLTILRIVQSLRYRTGHALYRVVRRIAPYFGTSPGTVERWFAGDRRGSFVERLMQLRGLRD